MINAYKLLVRKLHISRKNNIKIDVSEKECKERLGQEKAQY
jgi:hypothetical protein